MSLNGFDKFVSDCGDKESIGGEKVTDTSINKVVDINAIDVKITTDSNSNSNSNKSNEESPQELKEKIISASEKGEKKRNCWHCRLWK